MHLRWTLHLDYIESLFHVYDFLSNVIRNCTGVYDVAAIMTTSVPVKDNVKSSVGANTDVNMSGIPINCDVSAWPMSLSTDGFERYDVDNGDFKLLQRVRFFMPVKVLW